MNKNIFVNQLPQFIQDQIEAELVNKFLDTDMNIKEIANEIDLAFNSCLCDLSDTIDINKYLYINNENGVIKV